MTSINVPTHKEIYMISFLTVKGWKPNWKGDLWQKPGSGLTQTVTVSKRDKHGYFEAEEETEWFDLEDAFYQEELLE